MNKVRLIDPVSQSDALITDESSASPAVGPDGDVFFGVLENPFPSSFASTQRARVPTSALATNSGAVLSPSTILGMLAKSGAIESTHQR